MKRDGRAGISPRTAKYAAFSVTALVLAEIAATPFVGAGLSRYPGVLGTYVPAGDLVVDICIAAIALIVIWARPHNPIGWLMLTFAALGATQNFTEAYGVRALADPQAQLPLGSVALSLGTSLWIPAAALPATLLLNLYPDGRVAGRFWAWVNRVTVAAMVVATAARMRTEVASAVEDVRRIIDELRPAALEDVGLAQALRERAASLAARSASGMVIDVSAAEPLPDLPEQVEIAAFRIAEEAMTNVLRHARASRCEVRLEVDDALVVSVSDNGIGLPAQTRPDGIGLASMRQRADDLGGCCTVSPAVPSGVLVLALLPLEVTP